MNATNKTALVTGSSSGIGLAVAHSFLESGWNVVLNGRNPVRLYETANRLGHAETLTTVAGATSDRATGQAVVQAMVEAGLGGSIVNIGSVLVDHALGWLRASAPLASKGAIHALTVQLAAELAPQGIRVNAVAPGFVRTPLSEGADCARLAAAAMLGRVADVRDVAAAVLYLAQSSFVTGHILNVDGGFVAGRS
jgi:NAD(P)-dependent dehydrogenase (short-subunit alcohol dehydrogenase family)